MKVYFGWERGLQKAYKEQERDTICFKAYLEWERNLQKANIENAQICLKASLE